MFAEDKVPWLRLSLKFGNFYSYGGSCSIACAHWEGGQQNAYLCVQQGGVVKKGLKTACVLNVWPLCQLPNLHFSWGVAWAVVTNGAGLDVSGLC